LRAEVSGQNDAKVAQVPDSDWSLMSQVEGSLSQDHQDTSAADRPSWPPTAADFDKEFALVARSPGMRRVWQQASPDLPPEIEPYSFLSVDLLHYLADALALSPGTTLVDLGCGRGGPGLSLARSYDAFLVGVDHSAVAVQQANERAARFGLADRARFVVGDLAATGLAAGSADAVVSIDALHFAADPTAACREVLRLLRPGGRLALTNWQARNPDDTQLPGPLRIDWAETLRSAGFATVVVEARPEWHQRFTQVFQVALELGDPGDDAGLASLQEEAQRNLPLADLADRVVATAIRPNGQGASR
jgi:ubiquinone/menaquinone biosynthesis C-methylase UbiE